MCIKVSYVDERAAVFVVMRQTPLGVEEHQMEEISVFTIQDKIYTLPTHSKYFAAIDPLAGGTSCLVQIQMDMNVQSIEKISFYTVQNGNPDLKADPDTKMTRGILPFYVALYGDAWKEHVVGYTFDSFNLYSDSVVYSGQGYQRLEKKYRYLDIDADQQPIIKYDAHHVGRFCSEDQLLQVDMSYKIGEYYETKIKKDIPDLSETLNVSSTIDRVRNDLERLGYFGSVSVQAQGKDMPIQTLSVVSLQISQDGSILKYSNIQQPEMCREWMLL